MARTTYIRPLPLGVYEKPTASTLKKIVSNIAPLRTLWRWLRAYFFPIPKSDGYVESEHFDLVHFVTPVAYLTSCPSVYQPHDLQHLHYPQFFTKLDYRMRERTYRAFCNQAKQVCVQTEWTRQDLIKQYGIAPEKVVTIPWGSKFDLYRPPSKQATKATIDKYKLPEQFFFYPAVTWAHKNHEVIIRALHLLKINKGRTEQVYLTGRSTEYRTHLDQLAAKLGVSDRLHYLGFLSSEELQVVFSVATAMIFPSKFEGFGLPIFEAFHARLPVISSNASVLPEVAQDGALYFDPDSPAELAILMETILDNSQTRKNLIHKAECVLEREATKDRAVSFQTLYEKAGGKC